MARFYVLRNAEGELFAGFRPPREFGEFKPAFVKPAKGVPVQANIIHEDDLEETEQDLIRYKIKTDRVQVA